VRLPRAVSEATKLERAPRSLWTDAWVQFRRHRPAMAGTLILVIIVAAVALGPWLYSQPAETIDLRLRLRPPSGEHPFGTDDLGRDMLARVLVGGRVSLAVGLMAMVIAVTAGVFVGAIAGFFRRLDPLLMRFTDIFLALPQLPLLLLVVYMFRDVARNALGPEVGTFLLIVGVLGTLRWMPVARLVRASFLSIRECEYMMACRSVGVPAGRQILRHMLPNAMSPVIVATTLGIAAAILAESTLSFLGLGFPPDMPTWGRLLFEAKDRIDTATHWALFPGLAIFLVVLSINFIGDGLRDALDPRRSS
jgi:peptide/nickel transport system permease protein